MPEIEELKKKYDDLNDFSKSQCAKLLIQIESMKMCVNCINSDFTGCNKVYCNRHHEEMDYNSKCRHWEMMNAKS